MDDDARHLENWLNQERHGEMGYMENYFDKRIDPRLLVPGAKSVVSLLLNYYPNRIKINFQTYNFNKFKSIENLIC